MADRPLNGIRVLVTAEAGLGARLIEKIQPLGATAVSLPCIRIVPPEDLTPLKAILTAELFDWLVVTSRNGATTLIKALNESKREQTKQSPRIAAVGPSTAAILEQMKIPVSLIPPQANSQSLLNALCQEEMRGQSLLLLLGDLAEDRLQQGLESAGASVRRVTAYHTIEAVEDVDTARKIIQGPPPMDVVTLMSGSAARSLEAALGSELFRRLPLVSIGPQTEVEVQRLGARSRRVAARHTLDGLVETIVEEFGYQ